jgi:flagellar biosynthesis/type III secretory pathway M-ring protein FliF/YscJ
MPLGTLRRLVLAAAGVVAARGDRVSVVAVPFAHTAIPGPVVANPFGAFAPYAMPLAWVGAAFLALLLLLLGTRSKT